MARKMGHFFDDENAAQKSALFKTMPPSDWASHRPDAALHAPWRHRFLSRLLFRPSRHRMDCAKQALDMPCPWGKVQIWREAVGAGCNDMEQKCRPVAVLRFLGARGRAEQGTTDPLNRLPHVPGEVWIVNPPGFGGSLGPVSLLRHAQAALLAFDEMVRHCPHARHWVYGHSLGALFALHVAAWREVHGLILKNALPVFPLLQSRLGRKAARWLIQGMPPGLDALRNARHSPSPAVFQISLQDTLATPSMQQDLVAAYAGPLRTAFIHGGHDIHQYSSKDEIAYCQAIQWLHGLNTCSGCRKYS